MMRYGKILIVSYSINICVFGFIYFNGYLIVILYLGKLIIIYFYFVYYFLMEFTMINKFIDYFILNLKNNKSKNNGKIIINIINHTFLCVKFLFCIARRTLQPLVEPSIRLLI